MKKKVLFVGEHPNYHSGLGNMMSAVLSQVDTDKYQHAGFCAPEMVITNDVFDPPAATIMVASSPEDSWGHARLIRLLQHVDIDILCFVGLDIWTYQKAWANILQLRDASKFKIVFIFPYDIQDLRLDWARWMADCDLPCVYSQYGMNVLGDHVPNLRYFKPPMLKHELFKPLPKRKALRRKLFPTVPEDCLILGFVGKNQIRKCPERLLKAYIEAKRENPNIVLYLHMDDIDSGFYNLKQLAIDFGIKSGDLLQKLPGHYSTEKMASIYNAMDALVNCTLQEGLSWTPLEAMACGTPVIATDTTSQTELVMGAAEMVPCNDLAFIPVSTESGRAHIEASAPRVRDIRDAILKVAADPKLRKEMSKRGIEKARAWLSDMGDINDLLDATLSIKPKPKIQKVLFAQHSSAGDVLMTTQTFKGIKERHPKLPLVFMTQSIYQDIVKGNPYLDEIVDWDERLLKRYQVVYNPHGEHILSGGFNSLDVTLHSMYPYFCHVKPDEIFISPTIPDIGIMEGMPVGRDMGDGYIVVHTTGGSLKYRSYPHMDVALKGIGLPVIQIGGPSDIRCKSDLDLCGKLTWRESAWVMANAEAAVVIDSFLSHLAGAVGTDAVVLYGPAPPRVVGPKAQGCKIINLKPDMLKVCANMTHCWGESSCNSPCIHTISPMTVKKALKELL